MKGSRIFFLLFAKDESETIESTLRSVQTEVSGFSDSYCEIVVVDDSVDDTASRVLALGFNVINGGGKGLGHAYQTGIKYALENNADFIMTLDADGQVDVKEIPLFWRALNKNSVNMVIASRFLDHNSIHYNYPKWNRFGVFLLSSYLSLVTGQKITDSHGGIRLLDRRAAAAIRLRGSHSYVQESIISVAANGLKILELSSAWKQRSAGESRVVRSKWTYAKKMLFPLTVTGLVSLNQRLGRLFD